MAAASTPASLGARETSSSAQEGNGRQQNNSTTAGLVRQTTHVPTGMQVQALQRARTWNNASKRFNGVSVAEKQNCSWRPARAFFQAPSDTQAFLLVLLAGEPSILPPSVAFLKSGTHTDNQSINYTVRIPPSIHPSEHLCTHRQAYNTHTHLYCLASSIARSVP